MGQLESPMRIEGPRDQPIEDEFEVLVRLLPLSGARVLELGCGAADKTRRIAQDTEVNAIVAAEIDEIQHGKNLAVTDLPKVTFVSYGAEAIAEPDASFDIVVMFKSLHHVPADAMDRALRETGRVLKPGGLAYVSEPVFAGEFNDVMRLFHDESQVRREAFEALSRAVASNSFDLAHEFFFHHVVKFRSFDEFENRMINVSHTEHHLAGELLDRIREKFASHASEEGFVFEVPNRVDLLRSLS